MTTTTNKRPVNIYRPLVCLHHQADSDFSHSQAWIGFFAVVTTQFGFTVGGFYFERADDRLFVRGAIVVRAAEQAFYMLRQMQAQLFHHLVVGNHIHGRIRCKQSQAVGFKIK